MCQVQIYLKNLDQVLSDPTQFNNDINHSHSFSTNIDSNSYNFYGNNIYI